MDWNAIHAEEWGMDGNPSWSVGVKFVERKDTSRSDALG